MTQQSLQHVPGRQLPTLRVDQSKEGRYLATLCLTTSSKDHAFVMLEVHGGVVCTRVNGTASFLSMLLVGGETNTGRKIREDRPGIGAGGWEVELNRTYIRLSYLRAQIGILRDDRAAA